MAVQSLDARTLVRQGMLSLAVALAANAALVFVSGVAGIAPDLDPLNYGPVVLFTSVGVIGATVVYAALDRLSDSPDRTFAIVAVAVALVSLIPDVVFVPQLPGATTLGAVVLGVMHLTTAAACIVFLTDLPGRRAAG
ncbi:DUF6069 family protein [Halorientalis marina]|jgi:hypothetical protein|uniref:DUF6069 family protein n=1 Tax=Halorientalis marina TaxID=2931976 RepID=UPI001FF6F613|nr:DUF6069 family protein [Halorientalis marina]